MFANKIPISRDSTFRMEFSFMQPLSFVNFYNNKHIQVKYESKNQSKYFDENDKFVDYIVNHTYYITSRLNALFIEPIIPSLSGIHIMQIVAQCIFVIGN